MPVDTSEVRTAHAAATADVDCELTWDRAFIDINYSYVVNAFEANGTPAELTLVSRSSTRIVVRTLVNANITALAKPYTP